MNEEDMNKAIEKSFENFIKKLADNPDEVFDNNKLQKKYNNLLKEKINLQTRWNSLREYLKIRLNQSINGIRDDEIRKALDKMNELENGDNKCD